MDVSFKAVTLITGNSPDTVNEAIQRNIEKEHVLIYIKCLRHDQHDTIVPKNQYGAIVLTQTDMAKVIRGINSSFVQMATKVKTLYNTRKFEKIQKTKITVMENGNEEKLEVPLFNNDLTPYSPVHKIKLTPYESFNNRITEYFLNCQKQGKGTDDLDRPDGKDAMGQKIIYEKAEVD